MKPVVFFLLVLFLTFSAANAEGVSADSAATAKKDSAATAVTDTTAKADSSATDKEDAVAYYAGTSADHQYNLSLAGLT